MFTKAGYNESLKELVKANKADKSVVNTIKENLSIQSDAKSIIRKNEKEIKALNNDTESKMAEKEQTPMHNIKTYMTITKEIKEIKKEIKKRNNEVKKYNKIVEKIEQSNNELEAEIENQYKIYQENEIYTQAFYRIDRNLVAIEDETYMAYEKHIEDYNNAVYSVEKKSKLPKAQAEDLVGILNALKESDKVLNKATTKKKTATTSKKKAKKTEAVTE